MQNYGIQVRGNSCGRVLMISRPILVTREQKASKDGRVVLVMEASLVLGTHIQAQ